MGATIEDAGTSTPFTAWSNALIADGMPWQGCAARAYLPTQMHLLAIRAVFPALRRLSATHKAMPISRSTG